MSRYTKIAADGSSLPATATDHVAILDTTTGLMWSVRELSADEVNHAQAAELCTGLSLAGFNDWRLPTVQELFAIADHSRKQPAIDTDAFPNCKSDWYWTSTISAWSSGYAWIVDFNYGDAGGGHRASGGGFARAVRVAVVPGQ